MRKGELLALRKSDVGLKTGTLRVGRPHASDTTKGNREDLLPIAVGLVPYLREAMATSPAELLFPRCTVTSMWRTYARASTSSTSMHRMERLRNS